MSGGSFNHLYGEDSESILERFEDVKKMLKIFKLYNIPNSENVIFSFNSLIKKINLLKKIKEKIENDIENDIETLNNIMKAIEWNESGDYSIEEVKNVIKEFNSTKK